MPKYIFWIFWMMISSDEQNFQGVFQPPVVFTKGLTTWVFYQRLAGLAKQDHPLEIVPCHQHPRGQSIPLQSWAQPNIVRSTIWLFNITMENPLSMEVLIGKSSINWKFSTAMLNYQRVFLIDSNKIITAHPSPKQSINQTPV